MIARFDNSSTAPLDAAIFYAERFGWNVFPVHGIVDGRCTCRKKATCSTPGKHPRTRDGFKSATTDSEKIRAWWEKWPTANIGIATGSESRLLVIDVDRHEGGADGVAGLRRIQAAVGRLPAGPFAETGGGGFHFLLAYPGPTRKQIILDGEPVNGIDLQGDGAFIIAPPSTHSSGGIYAWKVGPSDIALAEIPEAWRPLLLRSEDYSGKPKNDTPRLGRERPFTENQGSQGLQGLQGSQGSQAVTSARSKQVCLRAHSDEGGSQKDVSDKEILEAIETTVPRKAGARHAGIFKFARMLKFNLGYGNRDPGDFTEYVRLWHEQAKPYIGSDIDVDGEILEFLDGWESARHPVGGYLGWCIAQVREHPPAVPLAVQRRGSKRAADLVRLCIVMERGKEGDTFFLPTTSREIHEYLGIDHFTDSLARTQTNAAIRVLLSVGVLEKVRQGSRTAGASEYRYVNLETS